MSADQNYPLHWPAGWPRTALPSSSRFGTHSISEAVSALKRELDLLKATGMVISSNATLGSKPKDKGICVYFTFKGKPYALPCDRWATVEENLWALGKHIEALRGQERWGVGTLERAFTGYLALPGANWYHLLGVSHTATWPEVEAAYREAAKRAHPDTPTGSNTAMTELNAAYAAAKKERNV